MTSDNGHPKQAERIELQDKIVVEASAENASDTALARQYEFEVVGIVQDSSSKAHFAVCYSEAVDEFIVTDQSGVLLSDDSLAQEILNDFLDQAGETTQEEGS